MCAVGTVNGVDVDVVDAFHDANATLQYCALNPQTDGVRFFCPWSECINFQVKNIFFLEFKCCFLGLKVFSLHTAPYWVLNGTITDRC